MAQATFEISEETIKALDDLKNEYGVQTNAAVIRRALALELIRTSKLPVTGVFEGMEIRNEAAILADKNRQEIDITSAEREIEWKKSSSVGFAKRFWEALEVKPGAFGVRIDVKKLFASDK